MDSQRNNSSADNLDTPGQIIDVQFEISIPGSAFRLHGRSFKKSEGLERRARFCVAAASVAKQKNLNRDILLHIISIFKFR